MIPRSLFVRGTILPAGRERRVILQSEDTDLTNQDVNNDEPVEIDWDYVRTTIRCKAWRGHRSGAYSKEELRDVEQEIAATVGESIGLFDPERATFKTFVEMVASRALTHIINARKCRFRATPAGKQRFSLTAMVDDADGGPPVELGNALTQEDGDRRLACETRDPIADFDNAEAFRTVFARLPLVQQELCMQVAEHGRLETQRRSGMSRRAFAAMLEDIQARFAAAGLEIPKSTRKKRR